MAGQHFPGNRGIVLKKTIGAQGEYFRSDDVGFFFVGYLEGRRMILADSTLCILSNSVNH
jgi:hypothetical protein